MENNQKEYAHNCFGLCCTDGHRGVSIFGLFLLGIGGYLFAQSQGWVSNSFPFWQLLLTIFGAYLVIKSILRRK